MIPHVRRRAVAVSVTVALIAPFGPAALAEEGGTRAAGQAQLRGRIVSLEGHAVAGATIIAYHLSTETVFRSTPTDSDGIFSISGLPYGYFDIAVQTSDGLYVADQVVNVPPAGKATLTMTLSPGGTDESEPRGFLGTEEVPSGVAQIARKGSGKSFFKTTAGIAVLAAGGGLVLLAIASGGSSSTEQPASPSGFQQ